MNKSRYIAAFLGVALLASCSTNEELVGLEEYDDLYYTPTERVNEPTAYETNELDGASSAESAYYGESPFEDQRGERPSDEFEPKSNEEDGEAKAEEGEFEDYYDPDYARRIENFHRNDEPGYVYNDAFANQMNPRFNMGFGFNSFGRSGFGMGMTMGSPWMGNRWGYPYCDPFFDPWCDPFMRPGFGAGMYNPWGPRWGMGWRGTWGMYDPFNPWGNPWGGPGWGMGWNNPWVWNNPWNNPWYGPGVIIVDGNNGSGRTIRNTQRTGNRTSRGGIVDPGSNRSRLESGAGNKSLNQGRGSDENVRRNRPVRESSTDYYNRSDSRRYSTERGTERRSTATERRNNNVDYSRRSRSNTRSRSESVISPYSRQQQSRSRSNNSYNRSRTRSSTPNINRNSFSSPRRSTGGGSYTPSRSRSISPSSSPSRSISPSRSGGGSRRR